MCSFGIQGYQTQIHMQLKSPHIHKNKNFFKKKAKSELPWGPEIKEHPQDKEPQFGLL